MVFLYKLNNNLISLMSPLERETPQKRPNIHHRIFLIVFYSCFLSHLARSRVNIISILIWWLSKYFYGVFRLRSACSRFMLVDISHMKNHLPHRLKMQQEKVIFAAILALVVIFNVQTAANPVIPDAIPPICEPGIVEEMPPHIKKVCMALENSARLNYALTNYIRNEAPGKISGL